MALDELSARVRHLEIAARRAVRDTLGGEYRSVFKGAGLTFEDVREYQPGDEVRRIDWNVTARAGTPFVKRFVEERELTVWLVVDVSASLDFGTGPFTKREVAAELAAMLAFCAVANRDRVGLLAFGDRVERAVPPAKGPRHALRIIRDLLAFTPADRRTSLPAVLGHLNRAQRRPAVVFLIGDFLGPPAERDVRLTARRHDLILVSITDPRERELPPAGFVRLRDAETGAVRLIDTGRAGVRTAYAESAARRRATLARLATSSGAGLIEADTTGDHADALVRYLRLRERRREQR